MRAWVLLACLAALFLLPAASCLVETRPDGSVGPGPLPKIIGAVAPLLPGPWGAVAGAAATALVGVGSIFAKRQVNAAFAAGQAAVVNPVSKMLAERKYLLPILTAIPMIGKALNLWELDWDAMLAAMGAAGVAVGADVYESKKKAA